MKPFKSLIAGAFCMCTLALYSQNVAINTTGAVANTSAMLDIDATTKGLLIPRVALSATNNNAPVGAGIATSLMVYNTATAGAGNTQVTPGYYYWDGAQWVRFITGALPGPAWMVTGNAGTNAAVNFAGTTDAVDFVFRTNNTERMRITAGGNAGIGTSAPSFLLTLGLTGSVFGVENTASFLAKNAGGGYETYLWPRWSDNIMYLNYGSSGFNIRNNGSTTAMFMTSGNLVGVGNFTNPQVRLAIDGPGTNVYATSAWVENNLHVQGNEALTVGGRGRLRVGTAWNYIGLYSEGNSSGTPNDLVLGSSSGQVRVGPSAGSGQNLRWANSTLRDDQGGSMELGGSDMYGQGGFGTPYIDWHINDGYTRDYDFRMIGGTDGNGDILTFWTYAANTLYRYADFDWIGAYDCWADLSAWRFWANDGNALYWDVVNDLDLIDNIRPKAAIDPKTHLPVVLNDPASMPDFLMTKTNDDKGYAYDVGGTANFSIGAIRMLRKETKTNDAALDARIDRLESIIVQLTGKPLGSIDYSVNSTAYAGIETFVVVDARVTKDSELKIEGLSNYTILNQENGSFTVKFTTPPAADTQFTYSGKF
jgi:hypothetical protein